MMSDDDAVLLNLPRNEEPITQIYAFVSVDDQGREGICSAQVGHMHWAMVATTQATVIPTL